MTPSTHNSTPADAVVQATGTGAWTNSRTLKNRNTTSLSILVPAYNEQYLIEASMKRLSVLNESPRLERIQVIVVDDCSKDSTPQAIARFQQFLETSGDYKKFQ